MQSDKSKNQIYIQREIVHNALNLSFNILGFLLLIIVALLSSIEKEVFLIVYSSIFSIFMISRIFITSKVIYSFNKLNRKINPENIDFYITKSWNRKREGSIWVGIMYILTLLVFCLWATIIDKFILQISITIIYIVLFVHLLIIMIVMYINIQMTTDYIKVAEKRINLHSVEWMQIKKDQSSYYKQLTIWYVHFLLVIPTFLLIIPPYRRAIFNK